MSMRRAVLLLAGVVVAACDNAGADRTLGISATGTFRGSIFFDVNGSGSRDAADVPFVGARVALLSALGGDTIVRATTGETGEFAVSGVPVGSYLVQVDQASVGDSLEAIVGGAGVATLLPNDSIVARGVLRYPMHTSDGVRAGVLGARVFVTGISLHRAATYSDTLLHMVDTSGAIRATRVRPSAVVAGDSVRLLGRIAERDGQRTLDDVKVFIIGTALIPTAETLTSVVAATGNAGASDAALVRVLDAAITDTATVSGSLRLTVDDGSGPLVVLLDRAADGSFRPPFTPGEWDVGRRFDFLGVLVPDGLGSWALRPRTEFDLTPR
jgi:hypothetical protein